MKQKSKYVKRIISKSHHRNGISGDPFDIYLFENTDGETMLAIDFGEMAFATLDVVKAASGDIAFGSNSFRGDNYSQDVRTMGKKVQDTVAKGALFVRWNLSRGQASA